MNEKALSASTTENTAAPITRCHVEKLFRRLAAFYTARWTATASKPGMHDEMVSAWLQELEGLSPQHLAFGVTRLRKYPDWPPTPARFRELCLPTAEESGYPDVHRAYRMATGADTSPMPAIVWATREEIGAWKLGQRPEHETWPQFEKAYNANVAAAVAGRKKFEFPHIVEPARRVEGPKRGPQPKTEAGREGLAAAKAAVEGMKPKWLPAQEAAKLLGTDEAGFDRLLIAAGLAVDVVDGMLRITPAGKRCSKVDESSAGLKFLWNVEAVLAHMRFNTPPARDDGPLAGVPAARTPEGPRKVSNFVNKTGAAK